MIHTRTEKGFDPWGRVERIYFMLDAIFNKIVWQPKTKNMEVANIYQDL